MRGYYKGLMACVGRSFPTNAVLFTVYELVSRQMNEMAEAKERREEQ